MKTIPVSASRPYPVRVERGLLSRVGEFLPENRPSRALIVTDETVAALYLNVVQTSLENAGVQVFSRVLPVGEAAKSAEQLFAVLGQAAENGLRHGDLLIALGGGVIGDVCGLAAALYLRGCDYLMLPTTLLADADSSVGGKTAVNLPQGKNLAGAFHQPVAVLCDPDALNTLPPGQFRGGMAEIIKYGMIGSPDLLARLRRDVRDDLEEVIAECVEMKARLVAADEFDRGERRLLNFGHTLGHAIEFASGQRLQHGEAVALGMEIITAGCVSAGLCPPDVLSGLRELLTRYGLTVRPAPAARDLLPFFLRDKKADASGVTLVLPESFGRCILKKCPFDDLRELTERGLRAL